MTNFTGEQLAFCVNAYHKCIELSVYGRHYDLHVIQICKPYREPIYATPQEIELFSVCMLTAIIYYLN